ncbi:hypothetical protein A7U60_g3800 [Sanghuangporus baumii]|uniref:Uncharacterized protein n=1 Tax=Sanghuangporus baumii TaxID=108892 RepID=A0A9Q5HZP6_SANBA|nr:hypothetical protein A7U60_g3800 [Sanghuangporus baumii]
MVRENSFSDSEGRSLTPDLEEEEDHDFIGPSSPISELSPWNQPTPSANAQPAVSSARASGSEATAAGSGLPPSGSPSVLFKDQVMSDPNQSNFSRTTSAPAAPTRNDTAAAHPARPITPRDRFRAAVHKVIRMKRGSTAMSLGFVGAEPGIDPRRASAYLNYGHIKQRCTIELVDYSSVRASFGRMENRSFEEFMMDQKASRRESWVKVRWINIGGVSWDVISALALKYDIHPLALEDVLHQRDNQARSKADYYPRHLFIRILRHTLGSDSEDEDERETVAPSITRLPRSASPDVMRDGDEDDDYYSSAAGDWPDEQTLAGSKLSTMRKRSLRLRKTNLDLEQGKHETIRGGRTPLKSRQKRAVEAMSFEQLKRGERVNVDIIPFFIFLFRDGTIISINQRPEIDFTVPITARLRQRDTGLRATADPSLLVQSLLDLIVDQALEVVDEYQHKILKLERDILVKPKMKTVRYLHIMSGDLTLHKRTLEPIKTLVYGLRRYDVDRCAALISSSGQEVPGKVEGFMSHKSKIYLADVHDHIDYIISSLDMFSGISENLINYTFNMASYEMNEVMRRLTLATIIFLPLTLLTGYFGMNFEHMWSVTNSDILFWEIAIPVMAVVIPIFTIPDIQRLIHFCKKKWATRRVEKAVRRSAKKTQ